MTASSQQINALRKNFEGEIFSDISSLLQYSTDASAYREVPALVVRPKHKGDIRELLMFAREAGLPIIPRAAGTSLAGQVVGNGIVADVSRHMNRIRELNTEERWVRVEPGVILDELNLFLKPHGLFFGPETSTSNRCMIGGMVGNNACGAHSLIYGSTRDHTLSIKAILSDGSDAEFTSLSQEAFSEKCRIDNLEGNIYRKLKDLLGDEENRRLIQAEYPHPEIRRRNTGYALDLLLDTGPFKEGGEDINLCRLLAGSEGTLAFSYEIRLKLEPLPPAEKAVMCIHCQTLEEAFHANLIALTYRPGAVELMDSKVLELSKRNLTQQKNRSFIEGDPAAILIVEFAREKRDEITAAAEGLEKELRQAGLGYHYPLLWGNDTSRVWALRKAGLGVLSNLPGDAKPVAVIEDTAVRPEDLPAYMSDFREILKKYELECVYHAHIGTGELHLRPVLNLKSESDVKTFRAIAEDTARLVKRYRGSLSGEHGDGRLRGSMIPIMLGDRIYEILKEIKSSWDPFNIFNPGKIVSTPPMNTSLRYSPGQAVREIQTYFDFEADLGILRAVEKCNGSGDCRKTAFLGGTMCPSYMATKDESASTRARANILREFLTHSEKENPFDHEEIREVLDLCLSCKACKSECPSGVDITKYKAEFLQHYYDAHRIPLRSKLIGNMDKIHRLGAQWPSLYNFAVRSPLLAKSFSRMLGLATERQLPGLPSTTMVAWMAKQKPSGRKLKRVYLFADEFTNYADANIGITAIKLLRRLGYRVEIPEHMSSGRTYLSKGMLKKARQLANTNVSMLSKMVGPDSLLIGIEPSAILTFRDEYPELVSEEYRHAARKLARNCFTIDEFIASEYEEGNIPYQLFTEAELEIQLHTHCYQKALSSSSHTIKMLSIPENYRVSEIASGCCGMAGSFGYEREHYQLSMKVGEMVLFPAIRKSGPDTVIAAPGTSCRQQITDGTGRHAMHPVEILFNAFKENGD